MPYPNEHAVRLQDPGKFDPKTYRRANGGTIYGSKKVPSTVAVIWGKLKKANKPEDNPIPQALRFPTKNWTVAAARKWLKDNNISFILFEPASKAAGVFASCFTVHSKPQPSFCEKTISDEEVD